MVKLAAPMVDGRGMHHVRLRPHLLLTLALLGAAMLAPTAADATAVVAIAPSFPSPVTVGATNVPASILVTNDSSAPDSALTLCNVGDAGLCTGSEGITLLPS